MRYYLLVFFLLLPLAVLAFEPGVGLNFDSREVNTLIEKGRKLGIDGNVREALDCFLRVIKLDHANIRARYYCGVAYLHLGEYFAAEREYDRLRDIILYLKRVEKRYKFNVTDKLNLAKKAKLLLEQQFRAESAKQNDDDDLPVLARQRSCLAQ